MRLRGKCDSGFLVACLVRRTVVWASAAIHLPEAIRKISDRLGLQSKESPIVAMPPHSSCCSACINSLPTHRHSRADRHRGEGEPSRPKEGGAETYLRNRLIVWQFPAFSYSGEAGLALWSPAGGARDLTRCSRTGFVGRRPLANTAPGALVYGYWRAVSPPGWLSDLGLGRIEESRTLPRRERPNGI